MEIKVFSILEKSVSNSAFRIRGCKFKWKKTQIDSQSYSGMGSYLIHRKSFLNAETCESEVSLFFY